MAGALRTARERMACQTSSMVVIFRTSTRSGKARVVEEFQPASGDITDPLQRRRPHTHYKNLSRHLFGAAVRAAHESRIRGSGSLSVIWRGVRRRPPGHL